MEPGKASGNIVFKPICNVEQQESQDSEIINPGGSREYEVEPAFSEVSTSEIHESYPDCACDGSKEKEREIDSKLSGRNDKFRGQETRVVD
jgi:hypothetical protein